MGNRAYIQIESERFSTPVILYGHWSGEDNILAVRNVLRRTDRIGDPTYLAAQIFYEFAVNLGSYRGELGFGIDSYDGDIMHLGDVDTVYVNADTGVYSYGEEEVTEFARTPNLVW